MKGRPSRCSACSRVSAGRSGEPRRASASDAALGYPAPRGVEPVRTALAAYLDRVRGTAAAADRLVMCTGFTQGLRLVCRVLRQRGIRTIAIEEPCHAAHRAAIQSTGLDVIPVPVDEGHPP